MPLFRNTWDNETTREPEPLQTSPPPRRRTGLFGSRRSVDHDHNTLTRRNNNTYAEGHARRSPTSSTSGSGGLFSRRRSSGELSDRSSRASNKEESSILTAKQKVADAENAERMADDALRQVREAVRDAREHVRMLEDEAIEDARRAKLKQKEAKAVGKSMKNLGRYGR